MRTSAMSLTFSLGDDAISSLICALVLATSSARYDSPTCEKRPPGMYSAWSSLILAWTSMPLVVRLSWSFFQNFDPMMELWRHSWRVNAGATRTLPKECFEGMSLRSSRLARRAETFTGGNESDASRSARAGAGTLGI